jgi:hypothetical protein
MSVLSLPIIALGTLGCLDETSCPIDYKGIYFAGEGEFACSVGALKRSEAFGIDY